MNRGIWGSRTVRLGFGSQNLGVNQTSDRHPATQQVAARERVSFLALQNLGNRQFLHRAAER